MPAYCQTITARNINEAWDMARQLINSAAVICRPSRAGEVMEWPAPVVTEILNPTERVLFDPARNVNHIFQFMEALWMLAGRNDTAFLAQFNPRMKEFSDDGATLRGAYGYRWRHWFIMERNEEEAVSPIEDYGGDSTDQLSRVIRMMRKSPDERRAVIAMWDASEDLERPDSKDVCCNSHIYVKIREGQLALTVCCRSNDVAWGLFGTNLVHFSFLQEYLATHIGVPVGPLYILSDSWHAYTERWAQLGGRSTTLSPDYYRTQVSLEHARWGVAPFPLISYPTDWDAQLIDWLAEPRRAPHFKDPFFNTVATPLYQAWQCYKADNFIGAFSNLEQCVAQDWRLACQQWLERIQAKRAARHEEAQA